MINELVTVLPEAPREQTTATQYVRMPKLHGSRG
ncbi:hypothetical protein ABIB99_006588 [Bradyrhizobium sp. LA6.1]|jgi:hypothetical protein